MSLISRTFRLARNPARWGKIPRILAWFYLRKTRGDRPVLILRDGIHWLLPLADDSITKYIFIDGALNDTQIDRLVSFMSGEPELKRRLEGDRILIDIGANYGSPSIPIAKRGLFSEIHSIEADETNFFYLSSNIKMNNMNSLVSAYNFAISNHDGRARFEKAQNNLGDHRVISAETDFSLNEYDEKSRASVEIKSLTLDSFIVKQKIEPSKIGLVWADVQGHEGHVFANCDAIKLAKTPIFCEFWPYGLKRSGGFDIFLSFVKSNYSYFVDFSQASMKKEKSENIGDLAKKLFEQEIFTDLLLF